jgi:peptidoglycan/LPS O-acetylase OafA/YrhL
MPFGRQSGRTLVKRNNLTIVPLPMSGNINISPIRELAPSETVDVVARTGYLPKLDGLRGVSIVLVLVHHFLSSQIGTGGIGVTIFFVLSGYLITSILIGYSDTMPLSVAAVTFFWRRILRLFPAYYLSIAAAALFGLGGMRETWWVNALYLSNFKVALDGTFGGAGHFWSLSVEEQFYLLWFFVVVAVPRRFLLPIIILSLIGTIAFRWAAYLFHETDLSYVLLPGSMGSLAAGALLAYVLKYHPQNRAFGAFLKARMCLFDVCVMAIAASVYFDQVLIWNITYPAAPLLAACLVTAAIDRAPNWRTDWLANPVATHIGKISYGIYVYHYFVPQVIDRYTHLPWLHSYTATAVVRFVMFSAVSVAVAELSWHLVERPILRLKPLTPSMQSGRSATQPGQQAQLNSSLGTFAS